MPETLQSFKDVHQSAFQLVLFCFLLEDQQVGSAAVAVEHCPEEAPDIADVAKICKNSMKNTRELPPWKSWSQISDQSVMKRVIQSYTIIRCRHDSKNHHKDVFIQSIWPKMQFT